VTDSKAVMPVVGELFALHLVYEDGPHNRFPSKSAYEYFARKFGDKMIQAKAIARWNGVDLYHPERLDEVIQEAAFEIKAKDGRRGNSGRPKTQSTVQVSDKHQTSPEPAGFNMG
jgi:hypothetical protein